MADNEQLTDIEKLHRLGDLIDWMLFNNIVESRRELAKRMHYQESTLSLVVNGKQPMSPKFLKALSDIDPRINVEWIENGDGNMIVETENENTVPPQEEYEVLLKQQEAVQTAQSLLAEAFKFGDIEIIKNQQNIVQKENETLGMLAAAFKISKEKMIAIVGNNNHNNALNSPNSANTNSYNGRAKTKRYVRKKPDGESK